MKKELSIFIFTDLLEHFPFRHVDKTKVSLVSDINPTTDYAQVRGVLLNMEAVGVKHSKRLTAQLKDKSGFLDLAWFQGANWIQKALQEGQEYMVYGKLSFFQGRPQIIHPEIEKLSVENLDGKSFLEPIYPTTEKLKSREYYKKKE